MELELSELFTGRKVDLRTPEDLSPYKSRYRLEDRATKPAHSDWKSGTRSAT